MNNFLKSLLFVVPIFSTGILFSQVGLLWVASDASPIDPKMANTSSEAAYSTKTDNLGNVYVLTRYYEAGEGNAVGIFKYSKDGDLIWKSSLYGKNTFLEPSMSFDVTADALYFGFTTVFASGTDNVYYTDGQGNYDTLSVNNTYPLNISGGIVKLDLSGGFIWANAALKKRNVNLRWTISDIMANSNKVFISGGYEISNSGVVFCNCISGSASAIGNCESCGTVVEPPNTNMSNTTTFTRGTEFYDSGGNVGNYGNNQNLTHVVCPGLSNSFLLAKFNSFNTQAGQDILTIYNGNSVTAPTPIIGNYSGTTNPGYIMANNSTGCLTFKFISNANTTATGWQADITCLNSDFPPTNYTSSSYYPRCGLMSDIDHNQNPFIIGLNISNGDLVSKALPDFRGDAKFSGIYVDEFDVYAVGYAEKWLLNSNNASGITLSSCYNSPSMMDLNNISDIIVHKYTTGLTNPTWYGRINGSGSEYGIDIVVHNGELFIMALNTSIGSNIVFKTPTVINRTNTKREIYLIKLLNQAPANLTASDRQLSASWVQLIESSTNGGFFNFSEGSSLSKDINGNLFMSFTFYGNGVAMNYYDSTCSGSGCWASPSGTFFSNGGHDFGFFKFSNSGSIINHKTMGGASDDFVYGIHVSNDEIHLAGSYNGVCDFEPTSSVIRSLTSVGGSDGYIAKYGCFNPAISISPSVYCNNEPLILTALTNCPIGACNFNYTWADPINGGSFSTNDRAITIIPSSGTNQRNLLLYDAYSGCTTSGFVTLNAEQEITLSTTPQNVVSCSGINQTFIATASPPNALINWYNSEGSIVGTGSTFTTFIPGTYSVKAELNGCSKSLNVNLNNYTSISPRILPDNPSFCGSNGYLQVVDCPNCSYSWTAPIGSSSLSSSSAISTDMPGFYEVDINDQNGCTQTIFKNVVSQPFLVPPIFSEDISGNSTTSICNGRPLIIKSILPASCLNCSYQWSDGTNGPYAFAFSNGNFNVTVTDNNTGCSGSSAQLSINLSNLNIPTITGNPPNRCSNISSGVTSPAQLSVSNTCVNCTYEWMRNSTGTPIGIGTSASISGAVFSSPSSDYYVKVTDAYGCIENSLLYTVELLNYSIPNISATGAEICGTNSITLNTQACNNCNYQWNQLINSSEVPITGAILSSFTTSIADTFFVDVTFQNGCIGQSLNKIIDVNSFTPTISPRGTINFICNGTPIDLIIDGPSTVLLPPNWNYQWFLNGAPISGSTGHIHSATTPGTYSLLVTKPDGCSSFSNSYLVNASNAGSNPIIVPTPSVYRCGGASVLLTANSCASCQYTWLNADGTALAQTTHPINYYSTNVSQGYYVEVVDMLTGCKYTSDIVEIKDTILSTPIISVSSQTNYCSTTPVILSTNACAGCTYEWSISGFDDLGNPVTWTRTTNQNTYTADTTGNYTVQVLQSGCSSPMSSSVPVTRLSFNALLSSPPITSICNADTVVIKSVPDASLCQTCTYEWYQNGVQIPSPANQDTFNVTEGGSYQAIIKRNFPGYSSTPYTFGCRDTTPSLTFSDVSVSVDFQSSAAAICGPSGLVTLDVNSCSACSYAWFYDGDTTIAGGGLNYIPLTGVNDTFYTVNGAAAEGMYKIRVTKAGCQVFDSILLADVPAPVYTLDSSSAPYANICGGTPITLTASCVANCNLPIIYQWYKNSVPIAGAIGASNLVISAGDYQLITTDNNGCVTSPPTTTVIEVNPPSGFGLVLDPVSVVPLTNADFDLDPYLNPVSLHTTDAYSAVPQPAAIVAGDMFSPASAGSGPHLVSYTYNFQNCSFVARDTIQVLSPMAVDVVNLNALAPPYESCLFDNIRFILSNFTFAPNQILFPTSSTTFDTVTVSNAGLTQFAGVWSGNITVIVPNGAITGKVVFRNSASGDRFQAPFFLVVQNPAVALSLNGVPQPLCSNADTIILSGFPTGGSFEAAYSDSTNVIITSLMSGNNFLVENVSDYDLVSGSRFLKLTYIYTPTYSNNADFCPDVIDSLNVQVNNMELDSIEYTPISETQSNVPLATLTRLIWPLENRNYPGNYVGTYVTGNNIQANTLPIPSNATSVNDSVFYTFTNGICSNTIGEEVSVWKRPTILDSIPLWVCQSDDTIFIGRNASGLYVTRNGTTYTSDANYVYENNPGITNGVDYSYDEKINIMTLSSSNGGLLTINPVLGADRYALVPQLISGTSTDITLTFTYNRNTDYFTEPTITTNYVIAAVTKTVNVEAPIAAQISPAILDDTTFCQDNITQQFSGIPNGGQYYLNGDSLPSNIFNPNSLVAGLVPAVNANTGVNRLTYIFRGNACTDSASTNILIPAQFSITFTAQDGPEYCQLDEPDSIRVSSSNPALMDNAAGVFLVNTSNSGQFFNPALPPAQLGPNFVKYIAQDIFGCTAVDSTIFNVNPMPKLRMTSFDPAYCLNDTPLIINLFEDTLFNPNDNDWHLQSNGYNAPYDSFVVTLTGRGVMPSGNNPQNPMYSPLQAGVGLDTIVYTFSDTVTGCSSTISDITFIKPLPVLTLTTTGSQPLNPEYCERDTVPVFATPAGGQFLSLQGNNFNTSNPPTIFANIPGISPATTTEIVGYTYQDPITFCKDTIRDTIVIRNFTTDAIIDGLPSNPICADDTVYVLNPGFGAGPQVTGTFGYLFPEDSAMISNTSTNTGELNPYLSGIYDRGRDVVVTYTYNSNNCTNTVYDTVALNPLPQLLIFMPGDTLFNSTDPVFHICFSAATFPLQGFNTYMGSTTPINRDPNGGQFYTNSGNGIIPSFGYWDYVADSAQSGLDTINFVYTDPRGCTNTRSEPIVVDTVPELGFAGFDPFKLDPNTDRFVYCANDMPHLVIPSPFGGATYWNYNPIPSILFELRPDTLVVGGQTTIHRLSYEFISARYQSGGVCIDSTIQFVEVRPTPILNLAASVPDFYCVSDSSERIILSATPSGGVFEDISNLASGGIVIGGVVSDSLFDPMAQMGRRIVMYYYTDTAALSGCTDTISKTIDVYNLPDVAFESGGGCVGDAVLFQPNPAGLSNSFPAIDSITMAIWNYGDGIIDTVTTFPNQILVPDRTHIYTTTGVYFPTLTLVNRGTCDTSFTKRIVVSPKVVVNDTTPYYQDFQASPGDWFQDNELVFSTNGVDSLWEWGLAAGQRITTLQESNLVWVTDLDSSYRSGEKGWVLSPCFDIGTLRRPMVALDIWRDTREGVDGVIMQYFDQPSQSWMNLGVREKGINWYNPSYVIASPGDQAGAPIGWSGISNSWEDARYRLDVAGGDLRGQRNLRLRLAFASSPNSVVGNLEGFAFDNFYIGNRTRSVLLEHFTNQSYSGMGQIETDLYSMVYDNLYGRDVNLVQYHTEYNSFDYLHQQSLAESNSRVLYYGINNADQIRINGQSLLSRTSDLVNGAAETLDMQMLQDAKFKIRLYPVSIQQGNMTITADVSALEDISYDDYALHLVVTEDSIESLQSHNLMSVVRTMRPDASGTTLPGTWVAGDLLQVANTWDFGSVSGITYNPNNLKVVVFVQNRNTKEVYQVATSRNLNIFNGPVSNVDEIAMEEGKEILDMNLYPNPTQNYFNVEFNSELLGEYDWKLVDVTGRVLRNGRAEAGTKTILVNTENFSPGMYIFSINNETVYAQRKVIIAR